MKKQTFLALFLLLGFFSNLIPMSHALEGKHSFSFMNKGAESYIVLEHDHHHHTLDHGHSHSGLAQSDPHHHGSHLIKLSESNPLLLSSQASFDDLKIHIEHSSINEPITLTATPQRTPLPESHSPPGVDQTLLKLNTIRLLA